MIRRWHDGRYQEAPYAVLIWDLGGNPLVHDGLQHPHLERIEGTQDYLSGTIAVRS